MLPRRGGRPHPPGVPRPVLHPGLHAGLGTVAVAGLGAARALYPDANQYSILTCTISYLGSPDADRNPGGWRIYQVGMTALILLMTALLRDRHRRFTGPRSWVGRVATFPLLAAFLLLLVAVWIPDSRSLLVFGEKATHLHTRLALLAIPVVGLGLFLDTVGRFLLGVPLLRLWPAHLFAVLVGFGFWKLAEWEALCRADPTLRHWPGDGIHSTPLWEWITFLYLVGHLYWMAHAPPRPSAEPEAGEVASG